MTDEMKRRQSKFKCHDCQLVFRIYNFFEQRRKYCPKCGDYISVKPLKRKGVVKSGWQDFELEWLDQLINGQITMVDMMTLTGREREKIWSRKAKRVKELGLRKPRKPWTDEEKELVDQCINGKIRLIDLESMIDRKTGAIQIFYARRLRKLKELYAVKENV